jgi:hypothetical protein
MTANLRVEFHSRSCELQILISLNLPLDNILLTMPPLLTQVARSSDGLPLVASQTPAPDIPLTNRHQQEAKDILRKITTGQPGKMSITSGDMTFYYMTRDSLCFLTMAESRYPKRLAFLYLDEVSDMVLSELAKEFNNNVSPHCQIRMTLFSISYLILCGTISGEAKSIKHQLHIDSSIMTLLFRGNNGSSKMNAIKNRN